MEYSIVPVIIFKRNFYTADICKKRIIRRNSKICTLDNQIKRSHSEVFSSDDVNLRYSKFDYS